MTTTQSPTPAASGLDAMDPEIFDRLELVASRIERLHAKDSHSFNGWEARDIRQASVALKALAAQPAPGVGGEVTVADDIMFGWRLARSSVCEKDARTAATRVERERTSLASVGNPVGAEDRLDELAAKLGYYIERVKTFPELAGAVEDAIRGRITAAKALLSTRPAESVAQGGMGLHILTCQRCGVKSGSYEPVELLACYKCGSDMLPDDNATPTPATGSGGEAALFAELERLVSYWRSDSADNPDANELHARQLSAIISQRSTDHPAPAGGDAGGFTMNARMEVGDTGMVNKDDAAMNWIRRAEVIKTPSGEGDVWGFRDLENGREIFTNEHFTFYRDPPLTAKPGAEG